MARDWQAQFSGLKGNERLLPKKPFVTGGSYVLENLYPLDRVKGMRFRGYLAVQIKDIPDKSRVRIRVT